MARARNARGAKCRRARLSKLSRPCRTTSIAPKRLLVDVTGVIKRDAGTGIQRVVKKVVEALYGDETYDIPAIAVRSVDGRLFTAHAYAATLAGKAPRAPDMEIEIEPGDRFFMLSDSWNAFDELAPCLRVSARRAARSSPASLI